MRHKNTCELEQMKEIHIRQGSHRTGSRGRSSVVTPQVRGECTRVPQQPLLNKSRSEVKRLNTEGAVKWPSLQMTLSSSEQSDTMWMVRNS